MSCQHLNHVQSHGGEKMPAYSHAGLSIMETQTLSDSNRLVRTTRKLSINTPRGTSSMVVVRIVKGVTNHFPNRVADWFLAVMLLNLGLVLLRPENTFDVSATYAIMARIASEESWAAACIFVGCIRIAALVINGTFPGFRWSPHIRFVCAMLSCFVWFQIALGFELSGVVSTGLAIYRYLVLFDIYNVFLAASEAGDVERRRFKHGGGG